MKTAYRCILHRAELAPRETQEQAVPRRRFFARKITYRYPVEEGIERILRALRSRLGPDAVDRE